MWWKDNLETYHKRKREKAYSLSNFCVGAWRLVVCLSVFVNRTSVGSRHSEVGVCLHSDTVCCSGFSVRLR